MNWMEIQEKLNELSNKYLEIANDKLFLEKEVNYQTKNQRINIVIFYLVKSIKNKINDMPKSDEQVRLQIMNLGNDINSITNYINKLYNDFELCKKGMQIIETLVELSDKNYVFKDGVENSLSYKQKIDYVEKTIEMMDKDNLTIEEKYDYIDSFDKNLSNEDKGELHVQALIGNDENRIANKKMTQILFTAFKGNTKKMSEYYQFTLEIGSVAEYKMDNDKLEQQIKDIGTILDSPFVQNMKQNNKSK